MRTVASVRLLTLIAAGLTGASMLEAQAPLAERAGSPAAAAHAAQRAPHPEVLESYGRLPLHFESNQGQVDSQVKFLARGSGYSLFLTPNEAVVALRERGTPGPAVLRVKLTGANPSPHVSGRDELSGKTNYFVGTDPAGWRTNIQNYARVHYRDVYPGIDLLYYGNQGQLEYDFVVAPGADPGRITMSFEGARDIRIDPSGDLILHVAGGDLRQHKPVVYQETHGVRQQVAGRYLMRGKGDVGFELGVYDEGRPLVIDPVLVYSTYLGGTSNDRGNDVAVDPAGNAYVTGEASSTRFPTTVGAFDTGAGGSGDAFVTKLDPSGSTLVYSTYLGGTLTDSGNGIAVDAAGNAYVTGSTLSTNFPVTPGAFDMVRNSQDAFVTKLNATGSALLYSTFLGGTGAELGNDIAVDSAFNVYVTGQTLSSTGFATAGARQSVYGGAGDAFVTKLNLAGSGPSDLVYSTYLGGSGIEFGNAIALDTAGNVYVTGETQSADYPAEAALYPSLGGMTDAFVAKLDAAGSSFVYSTYLGGATNDVGNGIAVDARGNAYVTGQTFSSAFPTSGPFQSARGGTSYAFVTKLNPAGSDLVYSTYLGGSGTESGHDITVDARLSAHVTGQTSPGTAGAFPTTPDALQPMPGGAGDAFVTQLDSAGSSLVHSTYLGGSSGESGNGIAVGLDGNAYVTGSTHSMDFPATAGAFDTTSNAVEDAFVTRIRYALVPASLTLDPREDTNPVGSEHCVTAAVQDAAGTPVPGVTVGFTVSGVVSTSDSRTTDEQGQAVFCYSGSTIPGLDAISAFADTDRNGTQDVGEPSGGAAKNWVPGPPASLTLTPAVATNPIGAPHCVVASATDAFGNPVSGVTVRFTIAGAVTTTGTAVTDANGEATFCYDGPVLPGTDSIYAYADADNGGGENAGEPWGSATRTWVAPPPKQTCGEVKGKGLIATTRGLGGFWFDIEQDRLGTPPVGNLVYAQRRRVFRSTQITGLSITGDKATIHGLGRENNGAVVPFQIDVTEGRSETFQILWPGYAAAGRVRGDVDITLGCDTGRSRRQPQQQRKTRGRD